VLDSGNTTAPRPFRRLRTGRIDVSPAGAQGTRPAAKPLPAAGRAASDTLLHEVESLLGDNRALRISRQEPAPQARPGRRR